MNLLICFGRLPERKCGLKRRKRRTPSGSELGHVLHVHRGGGPGSGRAECPRGSLEGAEQYTIWSGIQFVKGPVESLAHASRLVNYGSNATRKRPDESSA